MEDVKAILAKKMTALRTKSGMTQAELTAYVQRNFPIDFVPDRSMFPLWAEQTAAQGGARNTGTPIDAPHLETLYERIFQ